MKGQRHLVFDVISNIDIVKPFVCFRSNYKLNSLSKIKLVYISSINVKQIYCFE